MIGYVFFLFPMLVAFVWVSVQRDATQALLDLLAFSLLFSFDFAAILPNNANLLLIHVLLLLLLADWFLRLLISKKMSIAWRTVLVFFVVMFLVVWLAIVDGQRRFGELGINKLVNYLFLTYILNSLFLVIGMRIAKRQGMERFGKVFVLASMFVGVISIIQTASGGTMLIDYGNDRYLGIFQPLGAKAVQQRDLYNAGVGFLTVIKTIRFGGIEFYRASGTFDGSYTMLCVISLVLLLLILKKTAHASRWLFAPFVLAIAGFVSAFNRTAIVTFIAIAGLVTFMHWKTVFSARLWIRLIPPILLLGAIVLVYRNPIAQVVAANLDGFFGNKANAEVQSLNGRTKLWAYVIAEIKDHPLAGSNDPITMYRAGWGSNDDPRVYIGTHNSFLEFAYRGGIVAGVIFFSLFCFCLLRLYRLSRSRLLTPRQRDFFMALFIGAIGMFILQQTGNWIVISQIAAIFWIFCGYLAAYIPHPLTTTHLPYQEPLDRDPGIVHTAYHPNEGKA